MWRLLELRLWEVQLALGIVPMLERVGALVGWVLERPSHAHGMRGGTWVWWGLILFFPGSRHANGGACVVSVGVMAWGHWACVLTVGGMHASGKGSEDGKGSRTKVRMHAGEREGGQARRRSRERGGCQRGLHKVDMTYVHSQKRIFYLFLFAGFGGLCFTVMQVPVFLVFFLADKSPEW